MARKEDSSTVANKSARFSRTQRRRCVNNLILLPLSLASLLATSWIGYLVGWLTGGSLSPVAAAIAPLIFGLLTVLGIAAGFRQRFTRRSDIYRGLLVAASIFVFCYFFRVGLFVGIKARTLQYRPLVELLDDSWKKVDAETAARLYELEWRSRLAGVTRFQFEPFVINVVQPILEGEEPDKSKAIAQVISIVESGLPPSNESERSTPIEPANKSP